MKRPPFVNRSTVSLALVAAVAAAGCVSEADDSSDVDVDIELDEVDLDLDALDAGSGDEVVDEAAPADVSLGAASGTDLTEEENQCLDRGAVDLLGTDRFIELSRAGDFGTDVFLEPGEAAQISDLFFDCVDADEFLQRTFAADPAFSQLPTEFVDCILGEIDEDVLRSGLAATFSGADAAGAALEQAGADAGFACIDVLTPEQLEELANL